MHLNAKQEQPSKSGARMEVAVEQYRRNQQTGYSFQQLIADHQQDVWRYLRGLGCSADLADDLTQETLLMAIRRPFEYLGAAAAAGYLRRSAYHRYLSHLQQTKRQSAGELKSLEVTRQTWDRWLSLKKNQNAILDDLVECLEQLPPRAKLALELRYRDGLSRKEIARALRMTENGAKNLIQRAKKRLRDALECRMGRDQEAFRVSVA